jgi:iron only hydrogenase large subunit-like protein
MTDAALHPIRIDSDKCIGCSHCMRACPTMAVRVRNGKARILEDLCIDCGACLRVCPYDAVESHTTPFAALHDFEYKIAIPTTVLYGQFNDFVTPIEILAALRRAGFDEVYDLSAICELNTAATEKYHKDHPRPRPLISATCPVVVRLIQRRYPSLCHLILPIEPPREVAAKILRTTLPKKLRLPSKAIGLIHITPCPAKMVSINQPATLRKSYLDGAMSIRDIYPTLFRSLSRKRRDILMQRLFPDILFSGTGIGWSLSGGETRGLKNRRTVAVSGVRDTMRVLDQVETGLLKGVDLLECMVCPDGCVGGPLAVENRFLAKSRILRYVEAAGDRTVADHTSLGRLYNRNMLAFDHAVKPAAVPPLDGDPQKAIRKAKRREKLFARLPRKDCGACGAPDCRTLAEDIVRGLARLADCPFVKEKET